jgi:cell division protein FtsW (lipid II flippase)
MNLNFFDPTPTPHATATGILPIVVDSDFDSEGRERILLILAGLFVTTIRIALVLLRSDSILALWPLPVWIACAVLGSLALERQLPRRDPFLFPIAMLLSGWGLTEIDRLAPTFAVRQTIWLAVGVAALVGVTRLPRDLRWLSRYRYLWFAGGMGALVVTVLLHENPAELIKLSLLVFWASYLAENRELLQARAIRLGPVRIPSPRHLLPLLVIMALCAGVLVWQHDFGVMLLYVFVFVLVLYVATGQWFYLFIGATALLITGLVAYNGYSVARERFDIWWNPWLHISDTGYQIVQSLMAFASGSVFGQGIGQGAPGYIPVVHSDLIFAAIGEEWGMLGALAVVGCEVVLSLRAVRLSVRQAHPFRALLAVGIGLLLGTQSALIMAGTLKLVPLTGITLPFVSYGGSSLVISFALVGLLLVLSAE